MGRIQELEDRFKDGRDIRNIGGQKYFVPFSLELRLQRGLGVEESRCESPGFVQGIHTNHTALSTTKPHIWGEEGFTPQGCPDGETRIPSSIGKVKGGIADIEGNPIVDDFWLMSDDSDDLEIFSPSDDAENEQIIRRTVAKPCSFSRSSRHIPGRRYGVKGRALMWAKKISTNMATV